MIADMLINKKPNPIVTEYLLEVGNISLFLLHNFIFLFQKILGTIALFIALFNCKDSKQTRTSTNCI